MQLRCKRSSVWSLVLAVGFLAITGTLAAQAATPPVIDGNLSDLESYVDDVFTDGEGCGAQGEDLVEDIINNNFEANPFYPCSADSIVQNGLQLYFPNGFDQVYWAVAYDRNNDQTYLGVRTRGVIGDCDGDGDPGRAGACDPPPPGATTVGESDGISEFDDTYRWNIDDNCDGVIDYRIEVYGPAPDQLTVEVNGVANAGAEAFYSGTELEVRVPGLGLSTVWQASAFVDCIPDALGEDPSIPAKCQEPNVDLAITKTANPTAVCPGETTRFTITVTNTGQAPLDIDLTDTLPVGLTYAGNLGGSCNVTAVVNGQNIDFSDFSLDPGQSCTVLFDATSSPECTGTLTNIATATGVFADPCLEGDPQRQAGPVEARADVECLEEPCVDQVACVAPRVACDGATITVEGSARNCSSGPEDITINIFGPGGLIKTETFQDVPAGSTVTTIDNTVVHNCEPDQTVNYWAVAYATNDCGRTDDVRSANCPVECGVEPCVTVECRPPTQTGGAGNPIQVTGAATNCSDGPEDIILCIDRIGDAVAEQCTTFTDVPAGSTVTWTVEFPCDEPSFLVEVDARAINECRPNGVPSENGPAVCEVICEQGENCPRTPGYWTQQCKVLDGRTGGNVKLSESQLKAIAQCIRAESDWFDSLWADDDNSTVNGFCLAIVPPRPMNPFKQLQRHYAALLANYCSGSLEIINNKGQKVSLDLSTPIDCDGVDAETIGELIDEIDDALLAGDSEKYNDLLECADLINNGVGIGIADDCGDGEENGDDDLRGADISPSSFRMQQAAPNPFRDRTTIHYAIPEASSGQRVEISVYNVSGRLIRTLVSGAQGAGEYRLSWDGRNNAGSQVSKGVYFVQTRINGVRMGQPMRVLYLQ